MKSLRFENVAKSFGDQTVLQSITFSVQPKTIHFVLGASGTGKSVLLRHIVGMLKPDAGQIWVENTLISTLSDIGFQELRRTCQLVFQHALPFDHLTVLENIALPMQHHHAYSREDAHQRAIALLEQLSMHSFIHQYPADLSPGVQKRIAIIRALALHPKIMLYDEPTTSLDPISARQTDAFMQSINKKHEITSLIVTHDLRSVVDIGDHVTFLHQGRVCFDGTPQALLASQEPIVRNFIACARPRRSDVQHRLMSLRR